MCMWLTRHSSLATALLEAQLGSGLASLPGMDSCACKQSKRLTPLAGLRAAGCSLPAELRAWAMPGVGRWAGMPWDPDKH